MTLSSRIAVMDAGKLAQIGTPTEIYEFPESRFVADFIGSANSLEGLVTEDSADHVRVSTELGEVYIDHGQSVKKDSKVWIAIRPEKIMLSKTAPAKGKTAANRAKGKVDDIGYLGNTSIYKIRLDDGLIVDVTAPNQIRPQNRTHQITWEDTVYLNWDASSAMLLKT